MPIQDDLKREEYIEACAIKARVEAEWAWEDRADADRQTKEPQLITRKEIAEIFSVTEGTVRKWEAAGYISRVKGIGTRTVRYTREGVNKLKSRKMKMQRS